MIYSPHLYAPYVNAYLVMLPFFGKILFNATIRKEHWIGILLVVIGLGIPHLPRIIGYNPDPGSALDIIAVIWIVIINFCLCSQQVLNNKTVQTVKAGVGPNALVAWREISKMIFISLALVVFPLIGNAIRANIHEEIPVVKFETSVLNKLDAKGKAFLPSNYEKYNEVYVLKKNLSKETENSIKSIFSSVEYHRFFSLFEGNIFPKNWWPILFVVAAGLTGYIYSFGFFKLSKLAAHFWVPYTNVYLALLPFIMMLFGKNVTGYQIAGAIIATAGFMVGVSDYSRYKVEEIKNTSK